MTAFSEQAQLEEQFFGASSLTALNTGKLIGLAHTQLGRYAEAAQVYQGLLTSCRLQCGEDHVETGRLLLDLGQTRSKQRQPQQAIDLLRRGANTLVSLQGIEKDETAFALAILAFELYKANDLAGALDPLCHAWVLPCRFVW